MKKVLARILYEILAKHLPASHAVLNVGQEGFRHWCVQNFCGGEQIGQNVDIERNASISSKVHIGNHSGIGKNALIQGEVHIGNYVMMGPECQIWTINHAMNRTDIPMIEQGVTQERPVYIGDDVWIGSRVTILPGVRIGQGAVIGAGAVVTHDVQDYSIVAGNPATTIRKRK